MAVAGYLFNAAKSGNVTAQIFWMKTRGRWCENPLPQDEKPSGEGKNESKGGRVVVYIPDNGRDPELTAVLMKAQEEARDKYYARKRRQAAKRRPADDPISAIQAGEDWGLKPAVA